MDNKRIQFLDIARGLGIILMILNHLSFLPYTTRLSSTVVVPMFLIVSGYLFRDSTADPRGYIRHKARAFLLPYFSIGILHYIIGLVFYRGMFSHPLFPLTKLFWMNTDQGMPIAGALWYLTCIFFADLIFFLLRRKTKSDSVLGICCVVIMMTGSLFPNVIPVHLPWSLGPACVGVGYYYFGYLLRRYENNRFIHSAMNMPVWLLLILIGAFSVSIMLSPTANYRMGRYAFLPLSALNAIGFTFLIFNVSKLLSHFSKVTAALSYVGKNSITYLCFNQLAIFIPYDLITSGHHPEFAGTFLCRVILFLIAVLSLTLLNELLMRTRLKWLIGR